MNKKLKALAVLILLIVGFVVCDYIIIKAEQTLEIGYLTRIALYVIQPLLLVHFLIDVVDCVFEVDLRKPLVKAVTKRLKKTKG